MTFDLPRPAAEGGRPPRRGVASSLRPHRSAARVPASFHPHLSRRMLSSPPSSVNIAELKRKSALGAQ